MTELVLKVFGQQHGRQGINAQVLQEEPGIDLPDGLFRTLRGSMQHTCRIDQPVQFTGALRPVPYGGLIGKVELLPCDLRMIKRGRIAIAGRNNLPDTGSFGERLDECNADAA